MPAAVICRALFARAHTCDACSPRYARSTHTSRPSTFSCTALDRQMKRLRPAMRGMRPAMHLCMHPCSDLRLGEGVRAYLRRRWPYLSSTNVGMRMFASSCPYAGTRIQRSPGLGQPPDSQWPRLMLEKLERRLVPRDRVSSSHWSPRIHGVGRQSVAHLHWTSTVRWPAF